MPHENKMKDCYFVLQKSQLYVLFFNSFGTLCYAKLALQNCCKYSVHVCEYECLCCS